MLFLRRTLKASLLLLAVMFCASAVAAQQQTLGSVDFPVSASGEARARFLRGVAALHSFWYEEALSEFRAATAADPDFAMGYWGEAMAHNHPLWAEQNAEAARAALARIKDASRLTPREQGFIAAVRTLYGEGEKDARDLAYSRAMEKLHQAFPQDLEAAAFYALSLLGTVRPGERGFARQMKAGAIALDVYQRNANHPGAAHYVIHAFDDPEHAVLALPAARRYAEIAPEAHHARHMPSHIFIQLGMWPEAAASNESAWAASEAWVARKRLSQDLRDYHSLHWLTYVYLQQGRYAKAEEQLALIRRAMEAPGANMGRLGSFRPWMAAAYVVETEQWGAAEKLFEPLPTLTETQPTAQEPGLPAPHPCHAAAQATSRAFGESAAPRPRPRQILPAYVRGMAAAVQGLEREARLSFMELSVFEKRLTEHGEKQQAQVLRVMQMEISALLDSTLGNHAEAIRKARLATSLEEEMSPPSGPPDVIKPSHELFGEILLRAGQHQEAATQFAAALARQPNRARSLLGAARAAAAAGDRAAASDAYASFLRVRQHADERQPELKEARDYLAQRAAR